jgi:uncharacterized protein (DUF1330 family)
MSSITPNPDQFAKLLQSANQGPVVMINLLKFKAKADGEQGTGAEAYARYGDSVTKMVAAQGGKIVWAGRPEQILVGNPNEDWDAAVLVEYPSRQAFVNMVTSAEYQKAHVHREAGLERTVLIACTPGVDAAGLGGVRK